MDELESRFSTFGGGSERDHDSSCFRKLHMDDCEAMMVKLQNLCEEGTRSAVIDFLQENMGWIW